MPPKAILLDVEGTTTSLSFVKDTLFPYARLHLRDFLAAHAEDPEVQACLEAARELEAPKAGETLAEVLDRWMLEDRKYTPLKTLQGLMWRDGYARGELLAHLYDDVLPVLKAWRSSGVVLAIYSSGSVEAQQLLFGHTPVGDLRPLLSYYFDTRVGVKGDTASYETIAALLDLPGEDIAFCSDSGAELDAAQAAGLMTVQLVRDPGETEAAPGHPRATDFGDVSRWLGLQGVAA